MDLTEKSGLVSISFRNLSPEELIKRSKDAGLRYIEWGSDVHAKKDDPEAIEKIVRAQKEPGLAASSYGTYFKLGIHDVEQLYGYADAAEKLGTDIVRIWAGSKNPEDYTYSEKLKLFGDAVRAAEIGKETGKIFCFECHNWTYVSNIKSALELIEYVNSDYLQMYWQPNQFKSCKTNEEYAEKTAKYTKIIHVFNWEGDNKYPLSEAADIWKKYLACFGEYLFKNDIKFLLEFMPDGKADTIPVEAASLRQICQPFSEMSRNN